MSKNIKLVLSGSGTLYPAHVGAVIRLAEAGYVFEELVGTSGGSIVCAALASGYKPNAELLEVIKKTLPSKNKLIDPSVWSLFTKWGFIKGERIEQMMDKFFVKKFKDAKIPLHVVTCNIDRGETKVWSTEKDPNMDLSVSVRASMSIPGVFTPVEIDGDRYIDGGLTGNFMIDYFGDADNVVGVKFKSKKKKGGKIANAFDYAMASVNMMLEANTQERIEDADNPKIITIDSKYSGLNFSMTESDVLGMVEEGYKAASKWLTMRSLRTPV